MKSEYRKSWRCRFGIHRWNIIGYNSVLNPMPVEQCTRCGLGRQFQMCGSEIQCAPEDMKEAEEKNRKEETK